MCRRALKGEFKSGGKALVGKKKGEDLSKHGGGSVEVYPSIPYRDVVKSKLKAMPAKAVAILNQYEGGWPHPAPSHECPKISTY